MLPLTPLPLREHLPLAAVLGFAANGGKLGAWVGASRRSLTLVVSRWGRACLIQIDGDLGRLLRSCAWVVVRVGADVAAVPSVELIRVRALRVAAGLPYVPDVESVRALFPGAAGGPAGIDVPLRDCSPEEVLAALATHRVPIVTSRVVYGRVAEGRAAG